MEERFVETPSGTFLRTEYDFRSDAVVVYDNPSEGA